MTDKLDEQQQRLQASMALLESMKLAPKGKALKMCTWSAQGLFLHAFSAGVRAGLKFRELQT